MNITNILNRKLGLVTVANLQRVINSLFTTTHATFETTTLDTGRATVGLLTLSATLTEGTSALSLKAKSATKAFAGGATEVIPVEVPSGAIIVGAQIRNNTLLVATTGVSYSAAYSGGATQSIGTGIAFTKNTKTNTFFTVQGSGEATNITSNTTNITLTPNAGTLDTGTVEAVVYYYEFTAPTSVA